MPGVAYLRKRFPLTDYVGLELEVNQALVLGGSAAWSRLRASLIASLLNALGKLPG